MKQKEKEKRKRKLKEGLEKEEGLDEPTQIVPEMQKNKMNASD